MKTYYDILEISKYASKEVLERAHKTLIKKYHPDLESDSIKKAEKEEYIKKINEAYEVLSDDKKKREYDLKVFGNETQSNSNEDKVVDEKAAKNIEYERANAEYTKIVDEEVRKAQERIDNQEKIIKENLKKYERAYLRSLGYDVREPIEWKKVGITIISVIILLFIIWILYLIPPIGRSINNQIDLNTPMGMFFNIIKSIYQTIPTIFKAVFSKEQV